MLFLPPAAALDWRAGDGYRVAKLSVPAGGKTGFTRLDPAAMGIGFRNALSPQRAQLFQNLMNGSGVAAADVDGDGRVDLYFCHKQAANRLYRNLGDGRFEDITARAGVGCTNQSSIGAVFADVDGDGAPDLLVSSFGGPHALFHNDGRGNFTNVTATAGITGKSGGTSLALGDLDGDGDLDLYWCNFAIEAILRDGVLISSVTVNGQPKVVGRYANRIRIEDGLMVEYGDPDVLFLNDGHGRFTPVSWETAFVDPAGKPVLAPRDFGLAVQVRDINGDGRPDIYVCNDFQTPDRLWYGDGRGHFQAAPAAAQPVMSYASMGVDFADLDRDGRLDFITVEMLSRDLRQHLRTTSPMTGLRRTPGATTREDVPRNALYWNRGDGTWAEIACFAGVAATSWSWTPLFLDVDLDGWEDLLVSNGHLHDVNNRDITDRVTGAADRSLQPTKELLLQYPPLEPPKFAFRNRHDLTFDETSTTWGFNATNAAHGMITADFDDDGDLDVVLSALNGPPLIYRNNSPAPRVAVRLKGRPPNGAGVGARITLSGGPVTQTQEITAGGQYLSGSEMLRVFAAGTAPMTLDVAWRSGRHSRVTNVLANYEYEVAEPAEVSPTNPPPPPQPAVTPLFTDQSARLNHSHAETAHQDFDSQALLPQRYGQLGPGVAWTDLDGDGHVDLVMGAGRGGLPAAFRGDGQGGWTPLAVRGPGLGDDLLGVLAVPGDKGGHTLLGALANFETATAPKASGLSWTGSGTELIPGDPLPPTPASPGPMALGDVDGDGNLELFVGARLTVRRWPEPGGSRWYRREQNRWLEDTAASASFRDVGPVADALLVDLDQDGRLELVLACELGPIRIFARDGTSWKETTAAWGLSDLTGWWNSVAAGDFDGDGRLDLLAGNRGQNSTWQVWGDGRPHVTALESGDGSLAVIEGVHIDAQRLPIRDRKLLSLALPLLNERWPSHAAYADAGVAEILKSLGEAAKNTRTVNAQTLASHVLLNRAGKFDARPLPREAQWAPVFGIAIADFDGDGALDAVLAQNQFSVRPEDSRLQGGRSLWLRGSGDGNFTAQGSSVSGLAVDGEQRGAAAADYDADGRVDVVITQNGGPTRLFHNTRGVPGRRLRLQGGRGNPDCVGAVVRPVHGDKLGPAQTITAGGGYLSQPSPVLVCPGSTDAVEVRWPGGKTTRTPVPPSTGDVVIDAPGR